MPRSKYIFEPYYFPFDPNLCVTIDNFFSPEECEKIIELGEAEPLQEARVGDRKIDAANNTEDKSFRKATISWIPQKPEADWMWTKLHNQIIESNHDNWGFDLKYMDEDAQYTVYNGDGGHYDYHMDNGQGQLSVRKISIVANLNDPKEWTGGELQLYKDRSQRQGLGNLHLFPSYMLHRVTPVTDGIRRSLVLWRGGSFYK